MPGRFGCPQETFQRLWGLVCRNRASDLSGLDLLVIQIDGIHMDDDLILVAALGVDAKGDKHPLGLTEGATENAATVQALIDNLVERGLDPTVPRLFIIDGAKALTKAIRRTFGAAAAIQRCQVHKARNIMERLPKSLHASVRRVLRQAWELDDADKAEKLLRNLAQRLERDWSGVSGSIWKASKRSSPSPGLDCRRSYARSPSCRVEKITATRSLLLLLGMPINRAFLLTLPRATNIP